jgi:hypothetical protein
MEHQVQECVSGQRHELAGGVGTHLRNVFGMVARDSAGELEHHPVKGRVFAGADRRQEGF